MGGGGVVTPRPGTTARAQNVKALVRCAEAGELYLEGNREPLEDVSTRATQSDLGVSLTCQLPIYCLSAPNVPCIASSAKRALGPLNSSPLSARQSLSVEIREGERVSLVGSYALFVGHQDRAVSAAPQSCSSFSSHWSLQYVPSCVSDCCRGRQPAVPIGHQLPLAPLLGSFVAECCH